MKYLLLGSVVLLGACGHYSEDLAALDKQYQGDSAPLVVAQAPDDLNAIETASGPGMYYNTFEQVLAQDYYALARHENDQAMDYKAAQYFTQKAKRATTGARVEPGTINQFDIPDEQKEPLISARTSLVSALATQRSPENDPMLAKAVVCYDCWLDQAEEGKAGADATCADSFHNAMSNLVAGMNPAAGAQTIAVSFLPGQPALSDSAKDEIGQILTALRGTTPDTAKLFIESDDTAIAKSRAAALRSVLQFNGVDPAYFAARPTPSAAPVSMQPDVLTVMIERTAPASSPEL